MFALVMTQYCVLLPVALSVPLSRPAPHLGALSISSSIPCPSLSPIVARITGI